MANSRSIRDTLDAASGVNSSNMTTLATRMVDAITNYFITTYYPGRFVGVHKMDDDNPNYQFGNYYIFTKLVSGHGINTSQPYALNPNFGTWSFSTQNQGLKHLNDTVQFGKGISIGIAPGITNWANTGFISGTSLAPVGESNNTYRTTNIKMSDFRGLKKTDPTNNNYIYNAGDGMEEIYSSGPISVGDAA
jgi:hypothetical protein